MILHNICSKLIESTLLCMFSLWINNTDTVTVRADSLIMGSNYL